MLRFSRRLPFYQPFLQTLTIDFFREIDVLSQRLKMNTCFHILTGPVNSGKSMLIAKLKEELHRLHVPVTDINLRTTSFNPVDTLVDKMKEAHNPWLDQFIAAAKYFSLDCEMYRFKVKLGIKQTQAHPMSKLNALLAEMQKKLPPYTFWWGQKPPVFIIDEANELRTLVNQPNGEDALHNFLKWLVMNTKEQRRFHMLLASSDSFSSMDG